MKFRFEELDLASGRWRNRFEANMIRLPCRKCGVPVIFGAPYCAFHLDEEYSVEIVPEPRIGRGHKGLRATARFRAGDFIVPYGGEVVTNRELQERYGPHTAPYALGLSSRLSQDAALLRSAGAFSNHYKGLASVPNARFEKRRGIMWLRAIRRIERGEAILTDYGPDYELDEVDARYRIVK